MNKLEDYAYVAVSEGHKKFNWRKRYISLKEGTLLVYNDKVDIFSPFSLLPFSLPPFPFFPL